MNFFERQRQVRRVSARLVVLFVVAVVGIVIVVDLATAFAFNAFDASPTGLAGVLIFTSVVTIAAIGLASLVRTLALRGGGGRVARELGGVYVPQDTTDPRLRRLRNVVEEMAIAAGTPVPEVYLLPDEEGINAFAAGWSTSDAAVAVTSGTLDRLNRDELQGVIAHEFSHVVNGDMRLNIRLIGLLFGILFLSVIGRTLLHGSFLAGAGRSRDEKSGSNPLPIIGIALLVAGGIGVLAGRLIQASVSRQREYLADASAVQFTRQTSGIAGALKKIGGLSSGSKLESPKREEVGHMLFGPGARFSSLFATHPPLLDRIKVLEPSFDPAELERSSRQWAARPPSGMAEDLALGLVGPADRAGRPAEPPTPAQRGSAAALPAAEAPIPMDAGDVVSRVAVLADDAFEQAESLISQIPEPILARARDAQMAVPLVLGLLLAEQPEARAQQLADLARNHGQALADAALAEAEALAGLHPLLRLPLAQLAFPALGQRTQPEREELLVAVSGVIHADGRLTVIEYCLARMLYNAVYESMHPKPSRLAGRRRLANHQTEVATLLAALAAVGQPDHAAAAHAFAAGISQVLPHRPVEYAVAPAGLLALEAGWPMLDELQPGDKELLVASAVAVIANDGVMTVAETELLRMVCALLHCPLPRLA